VRLLLTVVVAMVLVAMGTTVPAWADWDPLNPVDVEAVKMHFPQQPNPTGWDIEILTSQHECADDWVCDETGPVTDVHFWISWAQDDVSFTQIEQVIVAIYDNDTSGPYPKPGTPLWARTFGQAEFTMVAYGSGLQGFSDPQQPTWVPNDHNLYQQINIKGITEPFVQQQGTTYWLAIFVNWSTTWDPVGWKTADTSLYPVPYTGAHYGGVAVYRDLSGVWQQLIDPFAQGEAALLDFAFVITSSPDIPTLGEWSMIVLVVLLVVTGVVLARRRRLAGAA
jgi:hypothetical protein